MKGKINNKLLIVLSLLFTPYSALADTMKPASLSQSQSSQLLPTAKAIPTSGQQYIVQLKSPSVSRYVHTASKGLATLQDSNSVAQQYRKKLAAIQQRMIVQIERAAPGAKVFKSFDTLVNAVAVTSDTAQIQKIKQLSGVAKVWPVNTHYLNMDASHQLIDSPTAWSLVGGQNQAGQNIKIAIVDTGIRNDNPMFASGSISPPDLTDNSYLQQNPDHCRKSDGDEQFCNNKIIVARWVNPASHGVQVYQNEHMSPLDFNGHGSHVAGIAAGNTVEVTYKDHQQQISGVAPGSYLMIYKALFTGPDGNGFASDTMLLEALEHAVNDGADVINNSWGTLSSVPQDSVFNVVITNAEQAGVVVVNAAGNDLHAGQGSTINCPACIESGIAVGNTTHGRFFGNKIMMTGQTFYGYQGNENLLDADQSLALHKLTSADPFTASGCSAFDTIDLQGKAVLVDYRNLCSLSEVASHAKNAGASLVIAYQGEHPDANTYEPLYTLEPNLALPLLGVTQQTGLLLGENHGVNINVSADITPNVEAQFADKLHPFSSTGPNKDAGYIKPDIGAPGTNILSALSPDVFVPIGFPGDGKLANTTVRFGMLTGTSMASPHVAGAAAIVKQFNPSLTAKQIKSTLTSIADPNVLSGAEPATPHGIGSGRLDLTHLDKVGLVFSKTSMSDPACIGKCEFTVSVTNLAQTQQQWHTALSFMDPQTQGAVSPQQITIDAGQSHQLTITVDVTRSDNAKWAFGQLNFSNTTFTTQHLPIAVFANDTDDSGIVSIFADANTTTDSALSFTSFVRNKNIDESVSAQIKLPSNTTFIENSHSAEIHYGQSQSLSYDESNHQLTWQGQLNKSSMALTNVDSFGGTTLAEQGIEPVACFDGCIGFNTTVAFNFKYIGRQYDAITLSDNGFAIPGEHDIDRWSALFNQALPHPAPLNNIIAPLWTEYDLADNLDENDYGGGHLRVKIQTIDSKRYLIAEWADVEVYDLNDYIGGEDDEGERDFEDLFDLQYTFQLIIEEDTDNIWFNYIKVPQIPVEATIGAENLDGSTGVSLYFDGQDNPLPSPLPDNGYTLKLTSAPEGIVTIDYRLALTEDNQSFATADTLQGTEDNNMVLDVLNNDNNFTYVTVDTQVDAGNGFTASKTIKVNAADGLDLSSLAIVQQPSHGSVSVAEGKLVYTPVENYFGADELSYSISDNTGKSSKATVMLNIVAVNDAPEITEISNFIVFEQQQMSINAQVSDVDSDNLEIQWQQTEGPDIDFTTDGAKLTFTSPSVPNNTLLTFEVTAKDEQSTTTQTAKVMVTPKLSSGGSLWIMLPLMFMVGWRRQRK